MKNKTTLILDGQNLNIKDIACLAYQTDTEVEIPPFVFEKISQCHNFLLEQIKDKLIYGVNTGFGPMASYAIGTEQLVSLQKNLIYSHAVGMGQPIKDYFVLAAMAVRLNTLCKGYSGVSPELVRHLKAFINYRIAPVVPEHGAVGTSGDLVQLAHIALALMGLGDVSFQGKRQKAEIVLKQLGLSPYELKPKEGLALINGTSVMAGIAALICHHSERLLGAAIKMGALALELVGGFSDSIAETIHNLRPHLGQKTVALHLRKLLASSHMLTDRKEFQKKFPPNHEVHFINHSVQEIYSLRCIPQILGPVLDILNYFKKIVETEINSATDNPLISVQERAFFHGGNFHGDYVAAAVDQLKMALVKLTILSERRTSFFLNHKKNGIFPPFLNLETPGLTLALQGLQFVATSTAAHSQSLAFPHSLHSISTNEDNQDVVSMGTDAALLCAKVVENVYIVSAIELICLTQAVDFLGKSGSLSQSSQALYWEVRSVFPKIQEDRVISHELEKVVRLLQRSSNISLDV